MKTKIYLFRLTIGLTAFFMSIGIFAVGRYFLTVAPPTELPPVPTVFMEPPAAANNYHDFASAEPFVGVPDDSETEAAAAKFDAEGSYYFTNEDAPKGFEYFENFTITNKDYAAENEDDYGKLIAPEGIVQTKKEYKLARISIGDAQIQFETESLKGVTYSFTGHFTETRNFEYLESEQLSKVLEGRLVKKRKGVKIAESGVSFGWTSNLSCGC
ncbi:MAG: hypothetical protein M3T96_08740 [Acidobacteriota bacterium]|nr:hypothetical protein [Acidobacteriota bacterium]